MRPVVCRAWGTYDVDEASAEARCDNNEPSLTVQSMAEDCDLNLIVKRYTETGQLPEGRPVFIGDFDGIFDFRSAQEAIRAGQAAFDALDAKIRARFGNDPQAYMEFCSESADGKTLTNLEEMRRMGIAVPAPAEEKKAGTVTAEPDKK